jgi:apolipoprotein N-acyltransferase
VRSANTGISTYIDPLGRSHGSTELFVPAARIYRAQTSDAKTLFVAIGDWVGWGCVLAAGVLVAIALRRRAAQRRVEATASAAPVVPVAHAAPAAP